MKFNFGYAKNKSNTFHNPIQEFLYRTNSFYIDINKAFEEYFGIKKTKNRNSAEDLDVLAANGHDTCNYLARYGLANYQIQAVMKLDGKLNYDKLVEAVRLSMDEEPVFRCRFIECDPPYWKRRRNIEDITFCNFEETECLNEAIKRFLESSLDMDRDLMVKIKLIRSGHYDTLCVKVNHTCCDGAGVKEYIQLIAEIYSSIVEENGTYIPEPRIGGRKDQDKLFNSLGIKNPEAGWNPYLIVPRTLWPFPWRKYRTNTARYIVCRLPYGQLEAMAKYGKARGATINDLILTAYYRAMFRFSGIPCNIPMDISSTVDLRRFLQAHKTEAIRNFSGGFITRIARLKDEPFEETLFRVLNMTNKIKNGYPGLQNAMGGEFVENMSFTQIRDYFKYISKLPEIGLPLSWNLCTPALSNVGLISRSFIKFGENNVTDAYVIPPAIRQPGFLLLVSSYNGILTLATGFYKREIHRKYVKKLLDKIKEELIKVCI